MMVLVVVVIMTAATMTLFVVMVVMVCLFLQLFQLCGNGCATIHSTQQLGAAELIPGSGHDGSVVIVFPKHFNCLMKLLLGNTIGTGQHDCGSGFHLIVIKLAKVLHINLDLTCIYHRNGIAQGHTLYLFHRCDHIRQLAHTGGLDDDAFRGIGIQRLPQSLTKIAHQGAANAAGVHLRNIDTGILQKTAVNADLTEFVLDQHQLLSCVCLLNHFLDQGGFTCTQKAGINIDNCHSFRSFQ